MVVDMPTALAAHPRLSSADWQLRRRIDASHTELFEFVSATGDVEGVFVKRSRRRRPGGIDRRLRREYRALHVLQRRLGPAFGRTVPVPLAALPEQHALIISAVNGTPLAGLLKKRANRFAGLLAGPRLRTEGERVGQWLRSFHDLTLRAAEPHDHDRFCAAVAHAMGRVRWNRYAAERAHLEARLVAASARLAERPVSVAGQHGDFLPQNILLSDDGVAVVDFESYRCRRAVHYDIGTLLAYLALLEDRIAYLPGALRTFAAAFVRGYGAAARDEVQALFTAESILRVGGDSSRGGVERSIMRALSRIDLPT